MINTWYDEVAEVNIEFWYGLSLNPFYLQHWTFWDACNQTTVPYWGA